MQSSQYDPGHAAFGGGSQVSTVHPPVLAAMVILGILIFVLPRKYVLIPLLAGIVLIPYGQNIYIGGVHLFVYRILLLVGWARVLASRPSGKFLAGGFSTLDKVFLVWAIYRSLAQVLLFQQSSAIVGEVAFLLDALGGYFLLRCLIRSDIDAEKVLKVFAIVAMLCALGMVREKMTGQNVFAFIGGRAIPDVRNGHIRAQGVFGHAILAGSFGATLLPMFIWLWIRGKARSISIIGAIASSVMAFVCASSTPIMAWLGALLAICLWPIRKRMRLVRWGIVVALVGLQLVMKAPVWFVISHIDIGGGSSWERANLIDTCIRHFGDWWLIGTRDNMNWGWDMWDQCNQFVSEAETGGIVVFSCFVTMIVLCFKMIGRARKAATGDRKKEWQFWLLGAMMFAQILAYMGIDYFDQTKFVWYALLAIVPAATMLSHSSPVRTRKTVLVESSVCENATLELSRVTIERQPTEITSRGLLS
jgi:hypothetical protein